MEDLDLVRSPDASSNAKQVFIISQRIAQEIIDGILYSEKNILEELRQVLIKNDSRSLNALARDLLPEEYNINPVVAKKVMHILINEAIARYAVEAGKLEDEIRDNRNHTVRSDENRRRQSGARLVEKRGGTPYTDQEMALIIQLTESPHYRWTTGSNGGSVNWSLIAIKVNSIFKNKRHPRNLSAQMHTMAYKRDERLERLKTMPISNCKADDQHYWESFLVDLIIEKGLYLQFADQILSILMDLDDLRSYWEIVRDVMPQEFEYGLGASNTLISMFVKIFKEDPNIDFNEAKFEERKLRVIAFKNRQNRGSADAMLQEQGVNRFTRSEFELFLRLVRSVIREEGPQRGNPNYNLIAQALNEKFNRGRTAKNLSDIIRTRRSQHHAKPDIYPDIDNATIEEILEAYFPYKEA